MAKWANDSIMDAALDVLKDNVTRMTVCSAQPTSYAEANSTYALADETLSSADFTIANGDSSGRKVTVAAKSGITVDANGTATHVALLDVANSTLLYVTDTGSQGVSAGGTVDVSSWKIEIGDPT